MKYDSLLLNCGGGIINDAKKSKQYGGSAALCIGIGGTGVAALSELKGKLHQQLEPDNPGEPIAKYEAIQLLALDSDETDYQKYSGNCKLTSDEFFSIHQDRLTDIFLAKGKAMIKDDPLMSWMEIDEMSRLNCPDGAGGVRQVGRYLLMSKASELAGAIQKKGSRALEKRGCGSLDIYIFAGISGGTGSGCFLDVCYLVRHVVETNGWNAKIMGYFFLPDVVTSKPQVAASTAAVAYNNSNGYAAMKELDYLMSLGDANDYFEQNYGPGIQVKTQRPPVDMCNLLSAKKADGNLIEGGFRYGINVAVDDVVAYLANVELTGGVGDDTPLTKRGHEANIKRGVDSIPKRWGANLSYNILGASNAEIPMTQINTYLAIGFFKKFRDAMYKPKNIITKTVVSDFAERLGFGARDVFNEVIANCPALNLPHTDPKILANSPLCEKGKLPESWATPGNDWLARSSGEMERNVAGLTRALSSYKYEEINDQSLVGRLFRELWKLSIDPNYGPYYATSLLDNSGKDLLAYLEGEITTADGQRHAQFIQIDPSKEELVNLNQRLIDKRGKKQAYNDFYDGARRYYLVNDAVNQCYKTGEALTIFKGQVKELHDTFFKPLCDMLDNLKETFEENEKYLSLPESKKPNAYTWQILSLDDVRERLDAAVSKLNEVQLVNRFVESLLKDSDVWLNGDSDKISLKIRNYMLELFKTETDRSLQDYLQDKFPNAKDAAQLADEINTNILDKVYRSAVPMFWSDPLYRITDPSFTFESSSLSVPSVSAAVSAAATAFGVAHTSFAVRKTGIGDRIFALRLLSGVPLFAYQGVTLLKDDYDRAATKASGVGSHLYAATGRGVDGSGSKDWRSYLPTPMPYSKDKSMVPEGDGLIRLYDEGVNRGIIGKILSEEEKAENPVAESAKKGREVYAIFCTPELKGKNYALGDFISQGAFDAAKYDAELNQLQKESSELHDLDKNEACTPLILKNDGDKDLCKDRDVSNVRKDYFIHYPQLQKAVREEIAKTRLLEDAEKELVHIREEFEGYDQDLGSFMNLLFFRLISCKDAINHDNYRKIQFITCDYNDRGDLRKHVLCQKDMPYSDFPLYQAFLSYRAMGEGDMKRVRADLDKAQTEKNKGFKTEEDTYVAAVLEQVWTADAMDELATEQVIKLSADEQAAVIRFYNGLRDKVKSYKDDLPIWPKGMTEEQLTAAIAGEAVAEPKNGTSAGVAADIGRNVCTGDTSSSMSPSPDPIFVSMDGKTLQIYPHLSLCQAWSQETGWMMLSERAFIWENEQWGKIRLDPNGNVIL